MALGNRTDPYLAHRYRVEIDGIVIAGFSEVTGLQAEIETEDYQEGGINTSPHKLPKGMRHPNLVLKRGFTEARELWDWYESSGPGRWRKKLERRSVRIIVLDSKGEEKLSWRCLQAWPVKWSGSDLKGDANTVAIESLELAHGGLQRA
ncbi:MAG TPA: phage tail protein [Chthoniobacter sp.]|nr:phage tail protein [Chthoniobacter sp.]